MKPTVRSALFCLALALLLPFAAQAADGDSANTAPAVAGQDEVAIAPLAATPAEMTADPRSEWLAPPEWTTVEVTTYVGVCPGPLPPLSCQCGPVFGEPGSEGCCYCNTCWAGTSLALCRTYR